MEKISLPTYGYIGVSLLGVLSAFLPVYHYTLNLGFIGEYSDSFGIIESTSNFGAFVFMIGVILVAYATFLSYNGKDSKLYGAIGGLCLIWIFFGINSIIQSENDLFQDSARSGIGQWFILIAGVSSFIISFIPVSIDRSNNENE